MKRPVWTFPVLNAPAGRRPLWSGLALLLLMALSGCAAVAEAPRISSDGGARPAVCGVDASELPAFLALGGRLRAHGADGDPLQIYRLFGVDTIRLRLFVDPAPGQPRLGELLELARAAREHGFRILLDLHYSNDWADPGHQEKPARWGQLSESRLEEAVESYTRDILFQFRDAAGTPDFVQLGNEITNGFLWPDGRLHTSEGENWLPFARLLKHASAGARAASSPAPPGRVRPGEPELADGTRLPRIILHLDNGGDNAACRAFLDRAEDFGIDYDIVGLSYYPWWHGDLARLELNLIDLAERYRRPILICETGYPWTLRWSDDEHNLVGEPAQLLPGFSATPAGQRDFLWSVREILSRVPGGLGLGLIYWAPGWVSLPGAGSPWENVALFDFRGEALPALRALGGIAAGSDAGVTPPAEP